MSKAKTTKELDKLGYRPNVGIMVLNSDNQVWVGHRPMKDRDEVPKNASKRWQMPQGGIDKGEDPLEAAKRELWEETGMKSVSLLAEIPGWIKYDLPDDLIGIALKGKYRGQKQRWFAFRFEGDESEINISHPPEGAPIEFDQWQWVDMNSLADSVAEFKRSVYEEVVSGFSHLA